jgi:hypothetical protein
MILRKAKRRQKIMICPLLFLVLFSFKSLRYKNRAPTTAPTIPPASMTLNDFFAKGSIDLSQPSNNAPLVIVFAKEA